MGPSRAPAPYADVELSFVADLRLRAMVRAVAVAATDLDPDQTYAQRVRETTDTLVCALLHLAVGDERLRCLFRVLDGEIRVRASLPDPPVPAPEAKARTARTLDRLDSYVAAFTTTGDDRRTELVYEAVVPQHARTNPGR